MNRTTMAMEQNLSIKRLGEYALGERLAAGGMAEIFHATCLEQGRFAGPIVLKQIHKHLADNRDFVNMFVDEARISSRLDHPNIVKLYDFQATCEGLYIILEYVDGPDVLSLLKGASRRKTAMPPEIAAYITCHILEALDFAHTATINGEPLQVVHRDVSPGNVLISRQGQIKLADFGIARANDRQRETATGTLKGKYGYMSPEQIEALPLDGRSDVFSAGIVLAELLMSKRLFTAANQLDVLLKVRSADLGRLQQYGSHIDEDLLAILHRALQRKREDRYATAGDFRDALVDWLAAGSVRMSKGILAQYISELESGGYISPVNRGEESGSLMTMSGTATKAAATGHAEKCRALLETAEAAQDPFSLNLTLGAAGVTEISSIPAELAEMEYQGGQEDISVEISLTPESALKAKRGALGILMPVDLIGHIAAQSHTGLLILERDEVVKEAFFENGHPVYVSSNDPQEMFGQFLLLRGLLSEEQLELALATAPHFGGRLGQTLVGLRILRPVDAIHLLAEQVMEKLLRSCCWGYGRFTWKQGVHTPHRTEEVHLSSFKIVARSLQLLSADRIGQWVEERREFRPRMDSIAYDEFGFGPSLASRLCTLNGERSIGNLLDSVSDKSAKVLGAAIYALHTCT